MERCKVQFFFPDGLWIRSVSADSYDWKKGIAEWLRRCKGTVDLRRQMVQRMIDSAVLVICSILYSLAALLLKLRPRKGESAARVVGRR